MATGIFTTKKKFLITACLVVLAVSTYILWPYMRPSTNELTAYPLSGAAPLVVTFTTETEAWFFGGVAIYFGDDSDHQNMRRPFGSGRDAPSVNEPYMSVTHEYTTPGTYTARLYGVGEGDSFNLGTRQITVYASE